MRRRWDIHDAGLLQPHDHGAWFGDGVDGLYSVASAALAGGARRGEKLLLVAEDPDPNRLEGLDGLERLLAEGQLELLALDSVYGTGSSFTARGQLAKFEGVLAGALAEGYRGIRVVADNTPLVRGDEAEYHRWLAWEHLTDRFQSSSMVSGVCYFDRGALGAERQMDLAALHPVRSAGGVEPPFCLFMDGDAVLLTGTLDASSAPQLRRILGIVAVDRPLVLDLSGARFDDRAALRAVAESASAGRPIRLRDDGRLHRVASRMGLATPHLRFESTANAVRRCIRCGDVVGLYEPIVIVLAGERRETSIAGDPDAVEMASQRYHRACEVERITHLQRPPNLRRL